MPKGAVKSVTKRNQSKESAEMNPLDQTASATSEKGYPSGKHDTESTSVNSSGQAKTEKSKDSPPGKPRRVFVLAGTILKKKDARSDNNDKTTTETIDPPKVEEDNKPKPKKTDETTNNTEQHQPVDMKVKRTLYGNDDHPYEDPSIVVNNSTTLQQQKHDTPSTTIQQTTYSPEMEQNRRTPSPGLIDVKKSTESMKAPVKPDKKHPSVMAEHSIPRSIFALLVALLLSLIVFLALFFLLHCHPVLSVVVAVLVFTLIFMVLGFLDVGRLKCLILLFLPSGCSGGGKLALYVLLLYFVIKGPLCNTIGNIRSVRNSIICVNNEQFRYTISETFNAAQKCINTYANNFTSTNTSREELSCLKKMCSTTKDRLWEECTSENPKISQKVCNVTEDLSCVKLNQSDLEDPPENCRTPCQREFGAILHILGEQTDDDHCGFLEIVGFFLPLLILLIFYEAYNYEKNYMTYNGFHNYFLTGHFQCIDQSRSSCDRQAVLPLRKVELRQHVRPSTICQTTDGEKKLICRSLKIYLVFLLIVLFIILADVYVFHTFNIEDDKESQVPNTKAPVLYKHNVSILVDLSKNSTSTNTSSNHTLRTMNTNDSVVNNNHISNQTESNESPQSPKNVENVCLVKVEPPGTISKVVIPIILGLLLVIIFLQAYVIRLQWYICSRLYNEREKERVFYLYNKILEDRIHLVEDCQKRMKCYHREMRTLNFLEPTRVLAIQSKWLSKIFKFFHINLRKCIICNDSEKAAFKICHGADCSGVYCLACSFDIDKKCLYCDTKLKKSLSKRQSDDVSSRESLV